MNQGAWPTPLKDHAYSGVIGDIARKIEPQTEADVTAVLIHLLIMFGSCIGGTPYFRVGADRHRLNLFAGVVGDTAKSRKGVSRGHAQAVFEPVDPDWYQGCITSGLSSGEGLISIIRDKSEKQRPVIEKGRVVDYQMVEEDPGVKDKRLLIVQTEFSSVLKVMTRDGNTLSEIIRDAWDSRDLRTITKSNGMRATAPHISIIGHITAQELRRYLDATEAGNGFGNRFIWVCVRRSRHLPDGGVVPDLATETRQLQKAVDHARRIGELKRDEAARRLWHHVYASLSAGRPGMLGAMTARAEAQVMRLACLYALADTSSCVGEIHLRAALELWRYCLESAACLFGDRLGDPEADLILAHLRRLYPESATRTEISYQLFHKHKSAAELDRALALLLEYKLATVERDRSADGRPTDRWHASEISEISDITPPAEGDSSLISPISPATETPDGLI